MAESMIDSAARISEDYECTLPAQYYLDTGNLCNLQCPFCPTGIGRKNLSKGLMSRETFDVIFEQIKPYAKVVGLYNWGEPFLNKHILYMASACAQHGIRSQIDSNLTLRDISDEEADAIVKSGLSQIYASIDGASQETYEKYRIGGRIDRALNNIRQIVGAKKRLKINSPDIGWNFLINKYNEHEIETAKEMAEEIGVSIAIKLMSCWDPSWKSSYHEQAKPSDVMEEETSTFSQPGLPASLEQLKLHPSLPSWCSQPFDFMVINWDGNVMPCCTVYGDEYTLGNVLEFSVEEVWNNARLRSCRKFLYNFGPEQKAGSVCESLPCPVEQKYIR